MIDRNEIKKLLNYEFLKEFRNEIFRNMGGGLDTFMEENFICSEKSLGWSISFLSTCKNLNNIKLYDYYRNLDINDLTHFNYEIVLMMLEENLILGRFEDVIRMQLYLDVYETKRCNECGHLFTFDLLEEIEENGYKRILCEKCRKEKENPINDADENFLVEMKRFNCLKLEMNKKINEDKKET